MFAQKLELRVGGEPVPKAWLDQFFMRGFTGYSAFDETLPAADGLLEAGLGVDPKEVGAQFEKWLRGRKMISPETELQIHRRDAEDAEKSRHPEKFLVVLCVLCVSAVNSVLPPC